jgi:PAS domain S-box-containing protein
MTKESKRKKEERIRELDYLKSYEQEVNNFLPVAFCLINDLDLILENNAFFEKLAGYDRAKAIGMNLENLFLEKEEIKSLGKEIKEDKEEIKKELSLITKNEKIKPVKVFVRPRVKNNAFIGYFLGIIDISEKAEMENEMIKKLKAKTEKLKEKEKEGEDSLSALLNIAEDADENRKKAERERIKTVAIIENFIDAMFFFGPDDSLNIINPKVEEFFDVKARDITGRDFKELSTFPTLKPLVEFIQNKDGEIADIFREELQINKDLYLEVTTTKITKEEENLGTLIHIHDITREKRIERIKSEFVSVAAHQLRTPLSGIKWTLETFLEEAVEEKKKLNEDEKMLIRKAYEANERMVSLVNDLLNVSRIEEGRYVYEPETVDLIEAMKPVVDEYKEIVQEKENITLKFNKPKKKLPKVNIDTEKIAIVIQNFLDNAIKYTEEGEVILSIYNSDEKSIKVSVQDNGIGIPEGQQERLFDKFFRAGNVV